MLVEQGAAGGDSLVLTTRSERTDWNILPAPPDAPPPGLPVLENGASALSQLERALTTTLQEIKQVFRLALGANLVQTMTDQAEGIRQLGEYLPRIELEGTGDLIYRINRPRRSVAAPHVIINRIATWSVAEYILGSVRIGAKVPPSVNQSVSRPVIRLTLDINNAVGGSAISVRKLPELFAECTRLAQEIALAGDIS